MAEHNPGRIKIAQTNSSAPRLALRQHSLSIPSLVSYGNERRGPAAGGSGHRDVNAQGCESRMDPPIPGQDPALREWGSPRDEGTPVDVLDTPRSPGTGENPRSQPVSLDAALGEEIPKNLGGGAALSSVRSFLWSLLEFSPHLEGLVVCHGREF